MNNDIKKVIKIAESGDVLAMKEHLKHHPLGLQETNGYGSTPLHRAAQMGHVHMVDFLIGQGALIDAQSNIQSTPLLDAAMEGHVEVLERLIKAGCSLTAHDSFGDDVLSYAVKGTQLDALKYLVNQGLKIHQVNDEGQTLMHIALRQASISMGKGNDKNHLDLIEFLYESEISIYDCLTASETPAEMAVITGLTEVVKLFLSKEGAHFANQKTTQGKPFLHLACKFKSGIDSLPMVKVLVEGGADLHALNEFGQTALQSEDKRYPWNGDERKHQKEVVSYLTQMEQFLLACKERDELEVLTQDIMKSSEDSHPLRSKKSL